MENNSVKFLRRHWFLRATRNVSIFPDALTAAGYQKNYKKYNVLPLEPVYIIKDGRLSYIFTNVDNMERYSKDLDKLYKNPNLLLKLERAYHHYGESLMKESEKLNKNVTLKNYLSYIKAAEVHFTGFQITNSIGTYFPQLLREKLKNLWPKNSSQATDILISELTYPDKRSPLAQSQKALLQLGVALQKEKKKPTDVLIDPKLRRKFKTYMQKFSFIPVNFIEEPWSQDEVLEQLKKIMEKNCQKELEEMENSDRAKRTKSKKLLVEIKNREIKNLVKAIQVGTYLNEYRKYVACYANLAYRPMLHVITEKYKLNSWEECWKLSPKEIERLYFKGDGNILRVLPSRNWAGVCFSKNKEGYRLMTKKEIALFLSVIEKGKVEEKATVEQKLTGVIANKGIIRGMARIISGRNEFHKFRDGDIIVTAMTSVDFVPLMKRAVAYVTNEGGITSHAAIVSRELNKPCIVGTSNATKILKDGDLIEVDAEKGVVKIINRA